jgi:hypothetical protein
LPRYFFNVHDGRSRLDREGTELPDLKTVREEAVRFAAGLLADHSDEFWQGDEWVLEVADEEGLVLFKLQFVATVAASVGD